MEVFRELLRRFRMLRHRTQLDLDLEEEMRLHLDLREQQLIDRGVDASEARRTARVRFGNTTRIKEESYMAWASELLQNFAQDVTYGARSLWHSRALSAVAVISLALGIGANTAIFSLLDAALLRSLPVTKPGQLVLLGTGTDDGIGTSIVDDELFSYPFYRELQKRNDVFSGVAAVLSMTNDVNGYVVSKSGQMPSGTQMMHVVPVSGTYFPLLGVEPQIGRVLSEQDDTVEGEHPVAVISQSFWNRVFNRDPEILQRKIKLGTTVFNIVGVAPAGFFGTKVGEAPDIWVPTSMAKNVPPGWDFYNKNFTQCLNLVARLKPGVSIATATSNVNLLVQQITRGFPDANLSQKNQAALKKAHVPVIPAATGISSVREFADPLKTLMGVVVLVLLIACANIANLLLARSTARVRELAVRQALGAHRARLIRQLLTESLMLALAGGIIGVALGGVGIRLLLRLASNGPETIPVEARLDYRVLAFTFVVTVATAILFGTVPAFRATRLQLSDALKDGRGPLSNASARNPLAKALVVVQVTLSLVLMVGAGLFLRTLVNLNRIDPGFNREGVLRLNVDPNATGMNGEDPRLIAMYEQIEAQVNALPGVKAASFSAFTFHEGSWNEALHVPGMPGNDEIAVHQNVVGDKYFATMEIPVLAGRTFKASDTAKSEHVAVISEHTAQVLFPPGNPIGRHFRVGDGKDSDYEVVGVVKDVKFSNLREQTKYINYLSYRQRPWGFGDLEVRYSGDFSSVSHAVQQAIHSVNPNLPIMNVTTLDEQVARTMTNQRLVAQLSTFFGLLAAFLSCIGIYGVMSYTTGRRTNEIGVRIALGANRSSVRWLVMRETLLLVSAGIALGVPVTLLGRRLVESLLYGAHHDELFSMVVSAATLLAVALFAGFLPAQRASKVDPVVALRYE